MQNANGDELTLDADGKYRVTRELTLQASYNGVAVDASQLKVVAFVSSYADESVSYYERDYSTSEVHNADAVTLAQLPNLAPCAPPTIAYIDGSFVCQSATPGSACTHEVKACMKDAEGLFATLDLSAPAFIVTATATATGYAASSRVSRTFTLADILGKATGDAHDVDGDGHVNKADVQALVNKVLKK